MKLSLSLLAALAALGLGAPAQAQDDAAPAETVSLDIYAIPSRAVVEAVARESKALAAHGMTTFYARGQGVHVTLYLTRYPAEAIPRIEQAIAALAQGQSRFPLEVAGTERTPSNWLFLSVARSPRLQRLADLATLAAEPWRARGGTLPEWMKAYPAKLPAFERYGSPNVFMQFDPHLTLLAEETSPELATYLAQAEKAPPVAHGEVEGIGIALVDAHGQIVKTLGEYRFGAKP